MRVTEISIEDAIARDETYVRRMERRYEVSSEHMLAEVQAGRSRETAEVCRWLLTYRDLIDLREIRASERTAGTPTTVT